MRHRTVLFVAIVGCGLAATVMVSCGDAQFSGSTDAGADTSGQDARPLDSAAADASDSGAPVFVPCTQIVPAPYFCADFDESDFKNAYASGSPSTLFTADVVTDGGNLGAAPGGETAPNILKSQVPNLPSGVPGSAAAIAPLTATGMRQHYRLDLDFRIDALGSRAPGSALSLFSLKLYYAGGPDTIYYRIAVQDTQLALGIGSAAFSNYVLGNIPPIKTWTHATIDVDFATNHLDVTVAGLPTMSIATGASYLYEEPTISLGIVSPGGSDIMIAGFDNITLAVDDATDAGDGG